MFNFNHLYYFYLTARCGSVSQAARQLRISQPSLSSQLKVLETSLGRALFRREGRGLALTDDGRLIQGYCRAMFEVADDLKAYLDRDEPGSRLAVGVSNEIERPFVAELVGSLLVGARKASPPRISMISGRHQALLESLLAGEIDLVLAERPPQSDTVVEQATLDMPVILVGSAGLASKLPQTALPTHILRSRRPGLVLPTEKLKLRHETDAFLQRHRLELPVVFESDMLSALSRAVAEGFGLGFLPAPYVERELKLGTIVAIGQTKRLWTHKMRLLTRKGRAQAGLAGALVASFAQLARQYETS